MPFVIIATLGAIGYKSWQHRGIPIDAIEDPVIGMPDWATTDFGIEDRINKISSKIYGLILLYIVLETKPWK